MEIYFIFHDIKEPTNIYFETIKESSEFGCPVTEVEYKGLEYSNRIVGSLRSIFSEIHAISYLGCLERIANECFLISTINGNYNLSFTFDSYEQHNQLSVRIRSNDSGNRGYDLTLERLKIGIKDLLIKEWASCTWVVDEQSETLGMDLYKKINKLENQIRAFVNNVLTLKFDVKWYSLIGFKKVQESYAKSMAIFKKTVPAFNNINDILIATTIETLIGVIKEVKIYETDFLISYEDQMKLHQAIDGNNAGTVLNLMNQSRKVKCDLWQDVFKLYFEDISIADKQISDFIANRNHVAHNKLLDKKAYEKIDGNISQVSELIQAAENKFVDIETSSELLETWTIEYETEQQRLECIIDTIYNETGIKIRNATNIFDLFSDLVYELHDKVDNSEYFNYAVQITELARLNRSPSKQKVFSVLSKVKDEFSFDIYVVFDITEGQGEESHLYLSAENDNGAFLSSDIIYRNGEAHTDSYDGIYVADADSELDQTAFNQFSDDLCSYINDDMNLIKKKIDDLKYIAVKEGGNLPIADFPCWNCYKEYVSLDNEIYPRGFCINCGEENEIHQCHKCGTLYSEDGDDFFCNYCKEKIERE